MKKGIRRSNKNRLTLSKTPIFGWWRPAWNLSFEARVGILASSLASVPESDTSRDWALATAPLLKP